MTHYGRRRRLIGFGTIRNAGAAAGAVKFGTICLGNGGDARIVKKRARIVAQMRARGRENKVTPLQRYVLELTDEIRLEARQWEIGAWLRGRNHTVTVRALLKKKLITGKAPGSVKITLAGKRELAGIEL